jgi:hypothetical protein
VKILNKRSLSGHVKSSGNRISSLRVLNRMHHFVRTQLSVNNLVVCPKSAVLIILGSCEL